VIERRHVPVPVPTTRAELEPVLRDATASVVATAPGPILAATLSVAGPVDRATGRLVQLPDSPFLVDDLDPVPLLRPALGLDAVVDNDVDWAALAEREAGSAQGLDDFVYVFLGPGLGGAVVTGGRIAHGGRGLAGEIAHLLTVGARGRSVRLIEAFAELGLRRTDGLALDLDLVRAALNGGTVSDRRTRDAILAALAGAIGSIAALLDPAAVLVGGPWSDHPGLVDRLPGAVAATTIVPTELRFAGLGPEAPHLGARLAAVREARTVLTGAA
jgi:predicted NBD/HSP70 family sugar kinase